MAIDSQLRMLRWAHLPECENAPKGWRVNRFMQEAKVIAGQSPQSETCNEKGEGLPFLQGNADFTHKYPKPSSWCTAAIKTAKSGDTLISVRAPVGEVNRADRNYAIGRGLAAVRATNSNPDFLYHALQRWRWCLQRVAQGTTFDAVTARHFAQLYVAVPEVSEEQTTIASILDTVDTVIERTCETLKNCQAVKIALAQKLFSEGTRQEDQKKTVVGFIPASWQVAELSSVTRTFQYGLSVQMQLKGTLPILRMGNIQKGDVLLDELKFVSLPDKVTAPYILTRGDVLFNRTNSQEHVGKVGIYRDDQSAVFASYLIRVVPDSDLIDNYFLGQILNSYSVQCRIKRYATPGVQQVNINATNLGKVLIAVPVGDRGIKEQREIAMILEQADEVIRSYRFVLEAQQALKYSLMHDLLTGKVRANDINLDTSPNQ